MMVRHLISHDMRSPYLQTLKGTSMRFYDVEDLVPGVSITLRDAIGGSRITVSERTASRTLTRHSCLAARITPRGASGKPEIERGCLDIPVLVRTRATEVIRDAMKDLRAKLPGMTDTQCYKEITPLLHEIWMSCVLDPPIPALANTDGEDLIWTRVRFDVVAKDKLIRALDSIAGIERHDPESNE